MLDITKATEDNYLFEVAKNIRGQLTGGRKPNVKEIILIRDGDVIRVSRSQVLSKNFIEHFAGLK
ncbi:MAG: hypothetical protein ACK5L5_09100 [Bacteroidales bacterium]